MKQKDLEAVVAVINRYVEGSRSGNEEMLRTVFHPRAIMCGYKGEEELLATPEEFIQDIVQNGSAAGDEAEGAYRAVLQTVEVSGLVASAVLWESGFRGSVSFVDHFHFICENGQWSIIAKTFTTLDE